MRASHRLLALLTTLALVFAGCLGTPDEARDDDVRDDTRVIIADLPDGTTEVEVDITAWDLYDNTTRVLVVVENTTREVLTQETFDVAGETQRLLRVEVSGEDRVYVTVRVIQGAADLDVEVRALVPGQDTVVVVHERVEIRPDGNGSDDTPATPTPDDGTDDDIDDVDDTTDDVNDTNDTNTTNETNTSG